VFIFICFGPHSISFDFAANIFQNSVKENVKGIKEGKTIFKKDRFTAEKKNPLFSLHNERTVSIY